MASVSTSAFAQQQGARPSLAGPRSLPRYRRSTTTRAPRKRTFIASMQKESAKTLAAAAAGQVHAGSIDGAAVAALRVCIGGDDGNMNGAGGRGNNNGPNGGGRGWGGDGSDGASQPEPRRSLPGLIGALALSFSVLAPTPSVAAAANGGEACSPPSPKLPKAIAMRHATLVVPNAAVAPSLARRSNPNSIMYGTIDMTRDEKRCVCNAQFHAREAVRVK